MADRAGREESNADALARPGRVENAADAVRSAAPPPAESDADGGAGVAPKGASESLSASPSAHSGGARPEGSAAEPVRLAVFDFDGTSIEGNSPVLLVRHLVQRKMLRKRVVARILLWGAAYKLRLPQNESWVRGLVFTAFEGRPADEVDRFLREFYDECVAPRWRAGADAAMRAHAEAGEVVVVVSASFEPIILRAMEERPFSHQIATRMRIASDGTYTREVEGLPIEGAEKLAAVRRFADARYGEGGWKLAHAYGDHHSDRTVLAAAEHPHAVDPDHPLARTARERGWDILDW